MASTKHPPGLRTLFFTEMWERFSYYGMRAILSLFMLAPVAAGGLGLPKSEQGPIYAIYTSAVYLLAIPGGWLADNILGQRKAVFWGGFVIMIGHILLALHGISTFYAGLACVAIGTGFLKPNISVIVGQLYDEKDRRREAGFSIFYMGINIGAFVAPIVCSWLAQDPAWQHRLESWGLDPRDSWHWGFGAAAVGMFFGLVQYLVTGRRMGDAGLKPAPLKDEADGARRKKTFQVGVAAFVAIAVGAFFLVKNSPDQIKLAYRVVLITSVAGLFLYLLLVPRWTPAERNRLLVISILFAGSAMFWGVFEQAGSTLNVFALESTDNRIFGWEFPSGWWQSVNGAMIVALAPVFSWLWTRLGERNPSYPTKFGIGLVFAGLGFLVLVVGANQWMGIWNDYLAKNKSAIVAAAREFDVKLPENQDEIRVAAVDEIRANAKGKLETDMWGALDRKDWPLIRAAASKYGVALRDGDASVGDVSSVIDAGKTWIQTELLPKSSKVSWIWLFLVYLFHTIGELCLSPVGLAAMTRLAPARVVGLMMGVWFLSLSLGNYVGGTVSGYYDKLELPTLLTAVAGSAFVMALIMFALVIPIRKMLAVSETEGGRRAAGH
jgi:proton-dependent oligopeptide transporter, POT family